MSIDYKIRKQVMAGRGDLIRGLLLTANQIELVELVGRCDLMTANRLADLEDVSIQNASSKLNRLYKAGYLERITTSAESGGIEYVYRAQAYGQKH